MKWGLIFGAIALALAGVAGAMYVPEPARPVDLQAELRKIHPANRPILIVAYGHSVPSGYFKTPTVQTFDSYPHLFHLALAEAYPGAIISVMTPTKGGETSREGAARFERDVLSRRPDLVTIDYGLNDVHIAIHAARKAWVSMIEAAKASGAEVILLTPTRYAGETVELSQHAAQIRELGREYGVPVADSYAAWTKHGDIPSLLSDVNHPNRAGHELVAAELMLAFASINHPRQPAHEAANPAALPR